MPEKAHFQRQSTKGKFSRFGLITDACKNFSGCRILFHDFSLLKRPFAFYLPLFNLHNVATIKMCCRQSQCICYLREVVALSYLVSTL